MFANLFIILIIISSSYSLLGKNDTRYELEQVVIFSRHNLRTPLSRTELVTLSPNKFPLWNGTNGQLTLKGAVLEKSIAEYFAHWFSEHNLTSNCPNEDVFYAYANTKQRTIETAQVFVDAVFKDCNVTVHHKNMVKHDPLFHLMVHNTTDAFKITAQEELIKTMMSLNLNKSFSYMDRILNFENSSMCRDLHVCTLTGPSKVETVMVGENPAVTGPLRLGTSVVDAFLMAYYKGLPEEDVAWGKIKTAKDWYSLLDINKGYHNVIFNTTFVTKDLTKPLIRYIRETFKNGTPRILLLMGHDANMIALLNILNFKPHELPNQYENTPVGSKIVFQKWYDREEKRYLLRVDFVYQSTEQIRNGLLRSVDELPLNYVLELKDCEIDNNGFCMWDYFEKIMTEAAQ